MKLIFNNDGDNNYNDLLSKESLETNGLGGSSSSTLAGTHSRSYHGLLVVSDNVPVNRKVLVSKLTEEIETKKKTYELDSNDYNGTIHPKGYQYLTKFERHLNPEFHYETEEFQLLKSIIFIHNKNTVVIRYKLSGIDEVTLKMRPFLGLRGIHALHHGRHSSPTESHTFNKDTLSIPLDYNNIKGVNILVPNSTYTTEDNFYDNLFYQKESDRGIHCSESLQVPGCFELTLDAKEDLYIVVSTEEEKEDGKHLFAHEITRRLLLLENFKNTPKYIQQLVLSADQFIVKRSNKLNTIIAGYHWFTDWGRDTMISLPGLCLVTGRFEEAKNILFAFAEVVDRGMIPNRFPENHTEIEYNTVDATLWYVIAIYKYYEYTNDKEVIAQLFPVIDEIVRWHFRGTRYGIKVDQDGLITAGEEGVQLTWMDAKAGDWVVTPRIGKAIEINALWYNTLKIGAELGLILDNPLAQSFYGNLADEVKVTIQGKFYLEDKGYLVDVLNNSEESIKIRPNQLFALSLPFSLFDGDKAKRIVETVEKHLLTDYGLRSLANSDSDYIGKYQGDVWQRDGAYHQGTTWSWLIGAFITAKMRYGGVNKEKKCLLILDNFKNHLSEYGLGTISEIFDGDAPYEAKGCVAQAWSVAEIIRVYFEDIVD